MVETVHHRSEPPIEYSPTIPGTLHLPRFSLLEGREEKRREERKLKSSLASMKPTLKTTPSVRPSLRAARVHSIVVRIQISTHHVIMSNLNRAMDKTRRLLLARSRIAAHDGASQVVRPHACARARTHGNKYREACRRWLSAYHGEGESFRSLNSQNTQTS